jgi:predicted nucleic acid-binding Zn ribbon protein
MKQLIARARPSTIHHLEFTIPMPTYVYETIPQSAEEQPSRFEIKQSMKDAALSRHPESGKPVRRVVIGGTGVMGGSTATQSSGGGSCGTGCGCHP